MAKFKPKNITNKRKTRKAPSERGATSKAPVSKARRGVKKMVSKRVAMKKRSY